MGLGTLFAREGDTDPASERGKMRSVFCESQSNDQALPVPSVQGCRGGVNRLVVRRHLWRHLDTVPAFRIGKDRQTLRGPEEKSVRSTMRSSGKSGARILAEQGEAGQGVSPDRDRPRRSAMKLWGSRRAAERRSSRTARDTVLLFNSQARCRTLLLISFPMPASSSSSFLHFSSISLSRYSTSPLFQSLLDREQSVYQFLDQVSTSPLDLTANSHCLDQ